jgi:hypothetical protein
MRIYTSIFGQLISVETQKENDKLPHRGSGR